MSPLVHSTAPRVTVLTPEGRGAIAVVRLWGPRALEVADQVFRPVRGASLAHTPAGRLRVGRVGSNLGDEVVAVVIPGTPPEVEIQCHGGAAAVALVVDALTAAGAERRQPVAWIRAASDTSVAAEAEVDLARAPTIRTAEILLEQSRGALENEVRACLAQLERAPHECGQRLRSLLDRSELGLRLVVGWRVVLAGRPNVGKSRLLNALAGYARAIVAPTPGTTRDVVTVRTALDGWPIELADTAGLRESDDVIEASGIALARARQQDADLILLVLDGSEPLTDPDRTLLESLEQPLVVVNKCDLPAPAWVQDRGEAVIVSAERGDGLETLGARIAERLVPDPPPSGAGVPFRPRHARALRQALDALETNDLSTAARSLTTLLSPLPDHQQHDAPTTAAETDGG